MRLTYWKANKNYENALSGILACGAAEAGIELTIKDNSEYREPEGDGAVIMGVVKREILWDHQARGLPIVLIDKGYCRERIPFNGGSVPRWWRMCWQDVHPTAYFMEVNRPGDRWAQMGMSLAARRIGGSVVILGSSGKFHLTMRMEDPSTWARLVAESVRAKCDRPIIYRPKPSWKYAVPVPGTLFDWGRKTPVSDTLAHAHCTITYGSIACVDSICAGVPCIVLGNAVAAPVASEWANEVNHPRWAPLAKREQWAANLAYCNFTPAEIGDGTAWKILKEQMTHAF